MGSSSNGGDGDGRGAHADEPVCRHTTVPVSSQAAKNGSQWRVKMAGRPSWAGNSGKLTALKPRRALARTSSAATATSASQGSCSGMIRSGKVPAQTSWCHWFQARRQASPSSGSSDLMNTDPQKPATREGKHSEAHTPLRSMSATRARDVEAAGPHVLEAGRVHAPVLPRPPDHRVEPDVGIPAVLVQPGLGAVGVLDDAGGPIGQAAGIRPSKRSGGSIRWSSTEMIGTRMARGSGSGSSPGCPVLPAGRGPSSPATSFAIGCGG